jgi:hypothetical protein
MRKLFGGTRRQAANSPVTSVVELRAHRMSIAACFVFQREISRSVFWDFRQLGQTRKLGRSKPCPVCLGKPTVRQPMPYFGCGPQPWLDGRRHFARVEKFFAFSGLREFNRDRRSDMTNALVETWKLVEFASSLERLTVRGHGLGSGPSKSASSKLTGK